MAEQFQKIQQICTQLEIERDKLLVIKDHMKDEIRRATSIKCWPTYVHNFPNGCEHGRFLVIDLGASSFRISLFHLRGDREPVITKEYYEIPDELLASEAVELFDYIAQYLQKFVNINGVHRDPLPLAVTFCFPLLHENLKQAAVTTYTNRFTFVGSKDVDLGKAMDDAIRRRNLRIQTVALLSDATGVLLASSWHHKHCKVGIVVGTATSASYSYIEQTDEIDSYDQTNIKPSAVAYIDWGDFGQNGLLDSTRIDLDRQVDKNSPNEGHRLFEKMVSGTYAAELVRCIFVICAKGGILFGGEVGKILSVPFSLKTRHIIDILADDPATYETTRLMFDKLGVMRPDVSECVKARYIVECVTRRSADLVATGIACLLDKIGDKHVVVGIDGSYYRNNSVYHVFLEQRLHQLVGKGCTFDLNHVKDGSDTGAAILAAIVLQKDFIYQPTQNVAEVDKTFNC